MSVGGDDTYGEFGNGTITSSSPIPVSSNMGPVKQISGSKSGTGGTFTAVGMDGKIYSWGSIVFYGGTDTLSALPRPSSLPDGNFSVSAYENACSITSSGTYCVGMNYLGDGITVYNSGIRTQPVKVLLP